jgi:hypothetical protein
LIDVLIPVLGRPQNAEKVAESLEVTRHPYRLVFICSQGDDEQIDACYRVAETFIHPEPAGPGNYAKKINWAVGLTSGEWVFTGADDIRFREGWDTAALRSAHRVIGTNDLHNPSVKAGRTATHFLIARSWIEQQGEVFHEGYDHWYVDRELVDVARAQGEWGFAADSHVEHLHPHWGLAEKDETYLKGTRRARQDSDLYQRRRKFRKR